MRPSFARLDSRGRLSPHESLRYIHLSERAGLYVVNEAADWNVPGNPRVRFHAPNLLAEVFFEIIEGMKVGGCTEVGSHFFGELFLEFGLAHFEQAAIGVIDDDELLGVEQVMGNDQRAQGIFCGDAAGIADHVRVSGTQTETALEENSGIHAGQHGDAAARLNREVSEVEVFYEFLVGFEQFVGD